MTEHDFLAEMATLGATDVRLTEEAKRGLLDVHLECRHVERGGFRATVTLTQDAPFGIALDEHLFNFREQLA